MKKADNHPDREEILRAVRTKGVTLKRHLARCEECRALFEYFSVYGVEEPSPKYEPSPEAVLRHCAIAPIEQSRKPKRAVIGQQLHDSWSGVTAMQVRDVVTGTERRLRFSAGDYTLELAAERLQGEWEFVAQLLVNDKIITDFVLQAGKQKLITGSEGCYTWNAKKPPAGLRVLSPLLAIDFGKIKW